MEAICYICYSATSFDYKIDVFDKTLESSIMPPKTPDKQCRD